MTEQMIISALQHVQDPELHKSLVELGMVKDISINGNHASVTINLTIQGCPLKHKIRDDVEGAILKLGFTQVEVNFDAMTPEERAKLVGKVSGETKSDFNNTTVIAIASGKGGVGKSTVAVNLAVAWARQGLKVGLIDADIYGFSIPELMGIKQQPTVIDNLVLPVECAGVKVMSMGFFVTDNSPVVWRGPMLGKMLRNFLNDVLWGELDILLLDLPPGTGDIPLDIHQLLPESKQILVTTPHPTAAYVAARAGTMAQKITKHNLLGVIENMAWLDSGGERQYLFGHHGGKELAQALQVNLLGQIPIVSFAELDNTSILPVGHPIEQQYSQLAKVILNKVDMKLPCV